MTHKEAVVTGAFGFLGRHTAKAFNKAGYRVTGIGHGFWTCDEWQKSGLADWYSCDITMENLQTYLQNPDVIVHCAGSGSVGYSITHPMQDFERTVTTTLTILEYIRLFSANTILIYPSSAAVYGTVENLPIPETAQLIPISPYGTHKKICEELISSYAQQYKMRAAIIRFFSLYGVPLQKQLLWDVCIKTKDNDRIFNGTGQEIRDWLHIKDAVDLICHISSYASTSAPIFNGGTGTGTDIKTIIEMLYHALGESESERSNFSNLIREGDPPGYIADMTKINATGWKPKIKIEQGINEYATWFKKL